MSHLTAVTELPDLQNEGDERTALGWPDIVVIVIYFIIILAIGLWSSRRSRSGSVSGYFLASRNMHWIPVGASLFASNIGSGHFIGLAGTGAASGIGVAGFELSAIYILMLLGWLFVPVYMSAGIYTMPEYLRERFGGQRIRVYLSFLALLLYIFTKISADLYAGALFIQLALNKSSSEWLYISILILLAIAAVFTIAGGLAAVIWTDFVQTILMILGAFTLMILAFVKVGGFESMVHKYPYATAKIRALGSNNALCGEPPKDYMNLLRDITPGVSDLPWTGMVFGLAINSIWYWCTDQVIVQRTLASKNMIHAKSGCILAAYLKFLPLWLLVFPGMIARILYPDKVACAHPDECHRICGSTKGCTNIAFVELVIRILPQGLSGLMLAVMMAALMSSLTSIFNSASTIFTIDVWTRFRKQATDKEKLLVGRGFVVVLVVVSIIWIPVIQNTGNSQLFDYIQSVSSFLAPPICAVYLLAIFVPRVNEPGAFWGLMAGLGIGMLRFIMEFAFTPPACGDGSIESTPRLIRLLVGNVHYLHFSCFLFLITGFIAICMSLITEPIPLKCLYRLTFWNRHDKRVRTSLKQLRNEAEVAYLEDEETEKQKNNDIKLDDIKKDTEEGKDLPAADKSTQEIDAEAAALFLKEDPFWKRFANINAIVCMTLATFVWGFFA